jgi:hypothetical protein
MQFLVVLLLFFQTVTSLVTSDLLYRDLGMTRYIIYPIDPGDTTKIVETEDLLKSLDSDAEILLDQGADGLTT